MFQATRVPHPEDLPAVIDLHVKLVQDQSNGTSKNYADAPLPDSLLLNVVLRVFAGEERAECYMEDGGVARPGMPLASIPLDSARIDRRHVLRFSGQRCSGFSIQVRSKPVGSSERRMVLLDMEKYFFVCDGRDGWQDVLDVLVAAGAFRCDFFTKYRVLEELGHGSASRIYQCESVIDDVEDPEAMAAPKVGLAVKMAHKGDTQFARERRTLRAIARHPNIIEVYGFFELDDPSRFAFLMPAMLGGDLHARVARKGRFSESKAACVARHLSLALAHLHERKIVHRDLKPENVMFRNASAGHYMHCYLIDFGLASVEGHEDMRMRCGTPGYVAPEVLRHVEYNTSVDCFSCGAVLFFALRGRCPFKGSHMDDVLRLNLRAEYSMGDSIWEQISEPCKELISGLLEKDPNRRRAMKDVLNDQWIASFGDSPCLDEGMDVPQMENQRDDKRFNPHFFRNQSGNSQGAVQYKKVPGCKGSMDWLGKQGKGPAHGRNDCNVNVPRNKIVGGPMAPHGPPEIATKQSGAYPEVPSNHNSRASTPTYPGTATSSQSLSQVGSYQGSGQDVPFPQDRKGLEPSSRQFDEHSALSRSSSATGATQSSGSSWNTLQSVASGSRPASQQSSSRSSHTGPSTERHGKSEAERRAQHANAGVAQRKRGLFEEFVKQLNNNG